MEMFYPPPLKKDVIMSLHEVSNSDLLYIDYDKEHLPMVNTNQDMVILVNPQTHWRILFTQFMIAFAICAPITLYIQLGQIFLTKNADGVSIVAYSLLAGGQLLWLIYAIWITRHRDWPIAVSSILSVVACILIIIACILYTKV